MQRSESMYLTSSNPATVFVLVPSGTSLDPNVDATSRAAAGFMAISPVGSPTLTRLSWYPWDQRPSPHILQEQEAPQLSTSMVL